MMPANSAFDESMSAEGRTFQAPRSLRQTAARRVFARLCCMVVTGVAAAPVAAVDPTVPDTMAQRLLACTPCHGQQGVSSNQGYLPRLAGKPAGYLHNQLMNFREGRRHNPAMGRLTENLSDDYLQAIAQHFAALDLPYPPPRTEAVTPALLSRGGTLVHLGDAEQHLPACTRCHGVKMMGVAPAIPGLLGLPTDYLMSQLGAWRTGLRQASAPDCMHQIAERLNATDLLAVASYLAAQPVPAGSRPQPAAARSADSRRGGGSGDRDGSGAVAAAADKLPLACGSVSQ